ncbi:hypothetical protein CPB85DRAFT_1434405 [Mucidula mucida]|nr:hypothetical protein CPB85DRAFT_1434405 [Mucidula mucida]
MKKNGFWPRECPTLYPVPAQVMKVVAGYDKVRSVDDDVSSTSSTRTVRGESDEVKDYSEDDEETTRSRVIKHKEEEEAKEVEVEGEPGFDPLFDDLDPTVRDQRRYS